jgi:hypothetical protein
MCAARTSMLLLREVQHTPTLLLRSAPRDHGTFQPTEQHNMQTKVCTNRPTTPTCAAGLLQQHQQDPVNNSSHNSTHLCRTYSGACNKLRSACETTVCRCLAKTCKAPVKHQPTTRLTRSGVSLLHIAHSPTHLTFAAGTITLLQLARSQCFHWPGHTSSPARSQNSSHS